MRKTKIVATLGPSSISKAKELSKHIDVFRINFAHGDEKSHKFYFDVIKDLKKEIPILVDLPGRKIRIGVLKEKIYLKRGEKVKFSEKEGIPVVDEAFYAGIRLGSEVYLADGNIKIRITSVSKKEAEGIVLNGGFLSSKKGINIPNISLKSGITEEDIKLLKEALKLGADFIGCSFVLSEEDIIKIKEIAKQDAWVIAKIEKKSALRRLRNIIKVSDSVMIARGDLGVEIGIEKIPFVQKRIIELSRRYVKPVILATQVLESMVNNPTPTRAEVTDIAHAVSEGVDAILLSDETAIGNYPVESAKFLSKILRYAETKTKHKKLRIGKDPNDAMALAAIEVAEITKSKYIVVYSKNSSLIIKFSRLRPSANLLCLCSNKKRLANLKICYAVETYNNKTSLNSISELIDYCEKVMRNYIKYKGKLVICSIDPKEKEDKLAFLTVHDVE